LEPPLAAAAAAAPSSSSKCEQKRVILALKQTKEPVNYSTINLIISEIMKKDYGLKEKEDFVITNDYCCLRSSTGEDFKYETNKKTNKHSLTH
jgi:hypothetical protein